MWFHRLDYRALPMSCNQWAGAFFSSVPRDLLSSVRALNRLETTTHRAPRSYRTMDWTHPALRTRLNNCRPRKTRQRIKVMPVAGWGPATEKGLRSQSPPFLAGSGVVPV